MKGLFTLPYEIDCKGEVLGKTFYSTIDGIPIEISFPRFNNSSRDESMFRIDDSLLAPAFAEKWCRGDEKLDWGYRISYSSTMNAFVKLIALSVDCDREQKESIADRIYKEAYNWIRAFFDYCEIVSKQHSCRDGNLLNDDSSIVFFDSEGGIGTFIGQTIHLDIYTGKNALSIQQIDDALRFAEARKELIIEYQLLLSAYNARRNCQNRHAIVDACSAVEQALNQHIAEYAQGKNIKEAVFTGKYRTLGDKFKLVKQIDDNFPNVDVNQIVDLRNDVAHNRKTVISDEETDKLILSVELLLQYYCPQYY